MTQQSQVGHRHDYRALGYQITDIDLTFDFDAQKTVVITVSQVARHSILDTLLRLNSEDLRLVLVHIDDEPWTAWKGEEGVLAIGDLPERFTLRVINEINLAANTALEGLYQSGDAPCTQYEVEGFRHITYYLDRPDVLACFTTRIIAGRTKYPFLLSDGGRVAQGELENRRHWVQWQDPFPKSCYLLALVAGDFDILRDTFTMCSGHEVVLELYVGRDDLDRVPWAITLLKNSTKWDEEHFGLGYDLDIYMIVAVDFFNMGVMKSKGPNTFNSKYMLACIGTATDEDYLDTEHVVDHECFHNWTGSRMTCHDWLQLSLKEGSTVFRDQEFSSDLGSRTVNRINSVRAMRGLQLAEDTNPMTRPIRPDMVVEVNNFYTPAVYEKGVEAIRMIHILLGKEDFRKGTQLYFERYYGSTATCNDFVWATENMSNVDLSHFCRQYSQSGTSIVAIKDDYNSETEQYTLAISQCTPATSDQIEKQLLHIPFTIKLYDNEGKVISLQKGGHPVNSVLNAIQTEQTSVFDNVYFQPVPALLCEFLVPVELKYRRSSRQLTFLMRHARNDFSHWDAAQSLLAIYIKLNVVHHQ